MAGPALLGGSIKAGVGSAVATAGVLAFSFVERTTSIAMVLIGLAALVALILGVINNRRLDQHLRETHAATKKARETIQEITALVDDGE